jgi:hypothetical protein
MLGFGFAKDFGKRADRIGQAPSNQGDASNEPSAAFTRH